MVPLACWAPPFERVPFGASHKRLGMRGAPERLVSATDNLNDILLHHDLAESRGGRVVEIFEVNVKNGALVHADHRIDRPSDRRETHVGQQIAVDVE